MGKSGGETAEIRLDLVLGILPSLVFKPGTE
jgi:hypothetical protein